MTRYRPAKTSCRLGEPTLTRGSLLGVRAAPFLYQVILGVGIPVDVHWNVTGAVSLVTYTVPVEFATGVTAK